MANATSRSLGWLRSLRRSLGLPRNPCLPTSSAEHLRRLRLEELQRVLESVTMRGRLLEIGAGRGSQAAALARAGFEVEAIDVDPHDVAECEWPVQRYDGRRIPFPNASFDFVFSSNTLEHVTERDGLQMEIRRVLNDAGVAIHIVPSAAWRFWTNLAFPFRYFFFPLRHGEHASNAWTEIQEFRMASWRRFFERTGWEVVRAEPSGLFYTGCSLMDRFLPIERRRHLARHLGSACHVFALRKGASKSEHAARSRGL
jgi:SAM-dependent methyltransferase